MAKGRVQYAALPWRRAGEGVEILLVNTSRGRWIIPKGWPMRGLAPHETAAQEAWEEAGVRGRASPEPLGAFPYDKERMNGEVRHLEVRVFALAVTEEVAEWPECDWRARRWLSQAEAAAAVSQPELARLLEGFSP